MPRCTAQRRRAAIPGTCKPDNGRRTEIMSAVHQQGALAPGMPPPLLRTLAVCDLVDSTALTEKLGDRSAAELMHKLDRLTRDLLYAHGGREIDKTDGFLV